MKTVISVIWMLCSMVLATKWFNNGERRVVRFGDARNRMNSKFWDWCYYMFLAMLALALPFGIILQIMKGAGILMKYILIIGGVGIVIYIIYSATAKKEKQQTPGADGEQKEEKQNESGRTEEKEQESNE